MIGPFYFVPLCYKVGQVLLQSRADFFVSQSKTSGITKQDIYYKVGQFFLQSGLDITKQGKFYYKVRQVLQSGAIITK